MATAGLLLICGVGGAGCGRVEPAEGELAEAARPVHVSAAHHKVAAEWAQLDHPPVADGRPFWHIDEVLASAVEVHDPPPEALRHALGRDSARAGPVMVRFCVAKSGAVEAVETLISFPGSPQIDAIVRATVSAWRFEPFAVEGTVVSVCSDALFVLSFESEAGVSPR